MPENGNSRDEHRKEIITTLTNLIKEHQGQTFSYFLENSPYSASVTRRWLRDMSITGIINYKKFGSRGEAEVWLNPTAEEICTT